MPYSQHLKGTMNIELVGHDFKDNPRRTKLKLGPLKLPSYVETKDELIYVGENDEYLHCFFVSSGSYLGIFKSSDPSHLYNDVLELNL